MTSVYILASDNSQKEVAFDARQHLPALDHYTTSSQSVATPQNFQLLVFPMLFIDALVALVTV
jgi:hypothetical protein